LSEFLPEAFPIKPSDDPGVIESELEFNLWRATVWALHLIVADLHQGGPKKGGNLRARLDASLGGRQFFS